MGSIGAWRMGALGSLFATVGLVSGIGMTVVLIQNLVRIAATIYQIKV